MKYYFPYEVDDNLNYYESLRNISELKIEDLLNPDEETKSKIERIEDFFISQMSPVNFRTVNETNLILEREKGFEKLCASMFEAGMQNSRELSMYDFRIRLEYFRERSDEFKNKHNNHAD